jgi:hypothetical protein
MMTLSFCDSFTFPAILERGMSDGLCLKLVNKDG